MYIIFVFRYVTYTISKTVLMVTTHSSVLISYLLQGGVHPEILLKGRTQEISKQLSEKRQIDLMRLVICIYSYDTYNRDMMLLVEANITVIKSTGSEIKLPNHLLTLNDSLKVSKVGIKIVLIS